MNLHDSSLAYLPDGTNSLGDVSAGLRTQIGLLERPTLRLKELLQFLSVGRSQAYVLMKTDPDFPKGVPLYDGENSPKFYWTHEAVAWLQGRVAKSGASKGGL